MTKSTKILNSIRVALGMESEIELMAEAILEDGTKIATDSEEFKEGAMAFVISEDGEKMPLPSGNYKTQDGLSMEVADGEVISISKEEAVEEAKSEDDEDYNKSEKDEEEMSSETEEVDLSAYATKEQLVEALGTLHTELSEMIAKVVAENENLKEELGKVTKMSAETPVKHSQTNLSTEQTTFNTGNKALDMVLNYKNNN
ncbi:MAG: hypothetical protein K0U52_08985 [Gammaproteobacteria bacterium]|jgi:hypothetical protein|nr:hypothetical protein [Gammaproteobacteria bacterium]